jgi:hypothetical protein
MTTAILGLHTVCTLFMAGVIWFVQLVHYPLFDLVGRSDFANYEQEHARRTTWVVAPAMGLEALSAIALVVLAGGGIARPLSVAGASLIGVIWASTAFAQVPCHKRLSMGYDDRIAHRLTVTNWIRTIAWSARAGIALALPAVVET